MSEDIIRQLKKLRHEPRAGYASEEQRTRGRERLMAAIAPEQQINTSWSAKFGFEFLRFTASDLLSKPVTAFASVAVLLLGSLTTASAASQSLPGDTLYGMKIVTERAQLQLANSDRKAVLHTEFAERRLNEIVAIGTTNNNNSQLVSDTVDAYRNEVTAASDEVKRLKDSGSSTALSVATNVSDKISALNNALDQAQKPLASSTATDDIKSATDSAGAATVETAVEIHEAAPQPQSSRDLQNIFRTQLARMLNKKTFDLGRINVITQNPNRYKVATYTDLKKIELQINKASDDISKAMDVAAAGGFRNAFESLRGVDQDLQTIESSLTVVEDKLIDLAGADSPADTTAPEQN